MADPTAGPSGARKRCDVTRWFAWSGMAAISCVLLFAGFVYQPPPSVDSQVESARFQLQLGLNDAAQRDLDDALEREPGHPLANLLKALVHERNDEFGQALECYERGWDYIAAAEDVDSETEYFVTTGLLRLVAGDFDYFLKIRVRDISDFNRLHGEPLVTQLPRKPGRKDSEYMHLFGGPIDIDAHVAAAEASRPAPSSRQGGVAELTERVERLEREVAELRARLGVESEGSGD